MNVDHRRALVAETLGTAFLLATVVGSGIMAQYRLPIQPAVRHHPINRRI